MWLAVGVAFLRASLYRTGIHGFPHRDVIAPVIGGLSTVPSNWRHGASADATVLATILPTAKMTNWENWRSVLLMSIGQRWTAPATTARPARAARRSESGTHVGGAPLRLQMGTRGSLPAVDSMYVFLIKEFGHHRSVFFREGMNIAAAPTRATICLLPWPGKRGRN